MVRISEIWEIQVNRKKHRITGEEKNLLLHSGDARFVEFRGLVINPAFISDMELVDKTSDAPQLPAAAEIELSEEQRQNAIERLNSIRKKFPFINRNLTKAI